MNLGNVRTRANNLGFNTSDPEKQALAELIKAIATECDTTLKDLQRRLQQAEQEIANLRHR